jgi:hypothetical protein
MWRFAIGFNTRITRTLSVMSRWVLGYRHRDEIATAIRLESASKAGRFTF